MTWRRFLPWILLALVAAAAVLGVLVYFRFFFRLDLVPNAWS